MKNIFFTLDVDECLDLVAAKCNGAQMVCTNFPGGFDCNCNDGYKMNAARDKCEGIDHYVCKYCSSLLKNVW